MPRPRPTLALVAKILALTLVLVVVQALGVKFLPATPEPGPPGSESAQVSPAAQQGMGLLALVLLIAGLQTVALAYPAVRSRWHGWRLAAAVGVVYFGSVTFMSQIESLVYLRARMPPGMLAGLFLMGLFNAAVFAPILVLGLGRWPARAESGPPPAARLSMPARTWAFRLVLGATVFLVLYYVFGYHVAWQDPAVRAYYGGADPGTFLAQMGGIVRDTPWMIPLQLARGLLWVLLALLVIGMMRGPRWEAGLAIALNFTVPVAYLLFPNPLMPEAVRRAHLIETAPYQFLFGWFVVWLFMRPPRESPTLFAHRTTRPR